MSRDDNIGKLKNRKICFNCVGDPYLSTEIRDQGRQGTCAYCGKKLKTYNLKQMSECIERAFEQHYVRTSDQPSSYEYAMMADNESDYEWEREGEPVVDAIMSAADIPEKAASNIQKILEDKFFDIEDAKSGEECDFSAGSYYEVSSTSDWEWQEKWSEFQQSIKIETRFFSRSASSLLASVFDGIDTMHTRDGRSLIVDAGPNTELLSVFRARSFQSDEKIKIALARPDNHLGAPPSAHANAGRMNARGISVFYGANDPLVALAEVRPPVGSSVVVARFEIIRPIRLLDLTALNAVTTDGSFFDPNFIYCLERTMFLRNLSRRITVPVMPDDEDFEYLATQAIADFLATENAPSLDGIIYPSVQAAGKALNIVLFHKASCAEEIELPKGAEISTSLGLMHEEGWEDEFIVFETFSPKKEEPEKQRPLGFEHPAAFEEGLGQPVSEEHSLTLKVDLESVRVHIIEAVQFKTQEYEVRRYRLEKRESES